MKGCHRLDFRVGTINVLIHLAHVIKTIIKDVKKF